MNTEKYFKNINIKFIFSKKYVRLFWILVFSFYLFFLETVALNVFFTVEYIPNNTEVRKKISSVKSKNDVINSIEKYFADKEDNLKNNLEKEISDNPFSPDNLNDSNSLTDNYSISEEDVGGNNK